jgi:hypothetical protein
LTFLGLFSFSLSVNFSSFLSSIFSFFSSISLLISVILISSDFFCFFLIIFFFLITFLFEDVFSIDILDLVISFLFGVDISFSLFGVTSVILFFSVLSKSSFSDLTTKFGEVKFDKFVSAEILSESSGRDIFFLIIFFFNYFFHFFNFVFFSLFFS